MTCVAGVSSNRLRGTGRTAAGARWLVLLDGAVDSPDPGTVDSPDPGAMFRSNEASASLLSGDESSTSNEKKGGGVASRPGKYPYAGAGDADLVYASMGKRDRATDALELAACDGGTSMVGAGCMPITIIAACAATEAIVVASIGGALLANSSFTLLLRPALLADSSFVCASVSTTLGFCGFAFGFGGGAVASAGVGRAVAMRPRSAAAAAASEASAMARARELRRRRLLGGGRGKGKMCATFWRARVPSSGHKRVRFLSGRLLISGPNLVWI